MPLLRKIVAVLLVVAALFFAAGLALAAPVHLGTTVTLAVIAVLMLVGAFFVWPRPAPLPLLDALISGRLK